MDYIFGAILCAIGGLGVGTFLLPLKFSRNWKWENSWIVGACFMYCLLPIIVLMLVSSDPWAIYREVGSKSIIILFVCGLIQGTGALVFTYGTTILGLSLGYALMIGCISVFGLLIPLFGKHLDRVFEIDGLTLLAGLAVLLIGIAFSGKAGIMRDRELAKDQSHKKAGVGLIIAVILWSGIANSFYYFIHEFGDKVRDTAISHNVHSAFAGQFNNLPFFIGMLVINVAITFPKMMRDNTLKNYWAAPHLGFEYFLAMFIGLLWFLGQGVAYAVGLTRLGHLGVSVGAALFMGTMILISNVVGVRTGEWKGVSAPARNMLTRGLVLLVLAMVIMSVGNGLQQKREKQNPAPVKDITSKLTETITR
jgi:L-rhamnose-H+ transport protein